MRKILIFNFRLNPKDFSLGEDTEATRKGAQACFHKELDCVEDAYNSGHTPALLGYDLYYQTQSMPYPGGYIFLLVMSRVPGENMTKIYRQLSESQLDSIRVQLAHTLE